MKNENKTVTVSEFKNILNTTKFKCKCRTVSKRHLRIRLSAENFVFPDEKPIDLAFVLYVRFNFENKKDSFNIKNNLNYEHFLDLENGSIFNLSMVFDADNVFDAFEIIPDKDENLTFCDNLTLLSILSIIKNSELFYSFFTKILAGYYPEYGAVLIEKTKKGV